MEDHLVLETGAWTTIGCNLSDEFISLLTPLLEKYEDYSLIEIEHILITEITRQVFVAQVSKSLKDKLNEINARKI